MIRKCMVGGCFERRVQGSDYCAECQENRIKNGLDQPKFCAEDCRLRDKYAAYYDRPIGDPHGDCPSREREPLTPTAMNNSTYTGPCEVCGVQRSETTLKAILITIWISLPTLLIGLTTWSITHGDCDSPAYSNCQEFLFSAIGWSIGGCAIMTLFVGALGLIACMPEPNEVGRRCPEHRGVKI